MKSFEYVVTEVKEYQQGAGIYTGVVLERVQSSVTGGEAFLESPMRLTLRQQGTTFKVGKKYIVDIREA